MVVSNEHALGALIDQAKQANGWSDQAVADRAAARGLTISKSNIARIRTEPVTTIVSKQLFALAAGLGIPVRHLAHAALESMGIPGYSSSSEDAEQVISGDPTLPEHVRRTLLTIIRTERTSRKDSSHELAPSDQTQQGAPSEAEREDQEAKSQGLNPENQGLRDRARREGKQATNTRVAATSREQPESILQDARDGPGPGLDSVPTPDDGAGIEVERQSDYDLANRNVGAKSKRQLQRERDEQLGEESQANPEGES